MSHRPAHDKHGLEDFAVKGMHLAKMTGVMVGSHAIRDAFLLMHSGVGCKYKTAAQGALHDLGEHPNVREAWTQISEAHLVAGCSDRIGPFARAWWERRESAFMVVVSAYFIELTGDDIPAAIADVEATLPDCPMVHIATKAPNGGFFDGYAAVVREAMRRMDWSKPPTAPRQAAVLGHFFHRYEPDTKADVAQLKALVKAAGLEPGPIFFSGQGYRELAEAPAAQIVVELPYTRPHDAEIRAMLGPDRQVVPLDLPIGVGGTARFVRTLAEATGAGPAEMRKVDAWLAQQTEAVLASVQRLTEPLRSYAVAVFADTPLAAGLVIMLRELGVDVPLVGLRDQGGSLGGEAAFRAALARAGISDLPGTVVMEDPSLRRSRDALLPLLEELPLGVIGSTHELDMLRHLPRSTALLTDVPLIEAGFPADDYHAVYSVPTLGFLGAAAWAHRLLDAFQQPRVGMGSARI
jgi:nitrogenase molybdenum-iron protein alpha/beta subunit